MLVYIKEFAEGTMNIARSVLNNDEVKALIKSIALDFVTNLLKKKSSDPAKDENLKTTVSTSNSAQAASSS